ncbi:MAG: polysaccharide deacetylase family protein [Chloroflexota bacterium]
MYRKVLFFILVLVLVGCGNPDTTNTSQIATSTPHPFFAEPTAESEFEGLTGESLFSQMEATPVPDPALEETVEEEETAVVTNLSESLRVPILTYHHISDTPASSAGSDFFVAPNIFEQQMAYLAENNYTPVDLDTLTAALTAGQALPQNPVVLTFDDGYADNYENAFPVLQSYGFTGTFFVITDFAEQELDGYMNWAMIKEMAEAGMQIQSHTSNHADLRDRTTEDLIAEIGASQKAIAENTGQIPTYLAYPKGHFDDNVLSILDELAFEGAVTATPVGQGDEERPFALPRLAIPHDMSLDAFSSLVSSGMQPPKPTERLQKQPVFYDKLEANWHFAAADDVMLDLASTTQTYTGDQAVGIRFANAKESVSIQVAPSTMEEYRRDQVFGLGFWLYSGSDEIAPDDFSITVLGSNALPYWSADDNSLANQIISTFSETRLYGLDFERPLPANTWIRVEIVLDDLQFDPLYETQPVASDDDDDEAVDDTTIIDPDFEFVTGFVLKAENDVEQTIYIDEVEILLLTYR